MNFKLRCQIVDDIRDTTLKTAPCFKYLKSLCAVRQPGSRHATTTLALITFLPGSRSPRARITACNMEGQDDLNSNDWSWFDQLVSGPLAGTPVAQPEAPMDFGERTGVFANGSPPEGQVASDLSFATLGSDCALPPYTMHFTDDVDAMFNGAFEGSSLSANNNATSGEAVIAGLPPRPDGSPAIV